MMVFIGRIMKWEIEGEQISDVGCMYQVSQVEYIIFFFYFLLSCHH